MNVGIAASSALTATEKSNEVDAIDSCCTWGGLIFPLSSGDGAESDPWLDPGRGTVGARPDDSSLSFGLIFRLSHTRPTKLPGMQLQKGMSRCNSNIFKKGQGMENRLANSVKAKGRTVHLDCVNTDGASTGVFLSKPNPQKPCG